MGRLADWGNYPVIDAEPLEFEQPEELREQLRSAGAYIAYGNGRSYGDASLQKKCFTPGVIALYMRLILRPVC